MRGEIKRATCVAIRYQLIDRLTVIHGALVRALPNRGPSALMKMIDTPANSRVSLPGHPSVHPTAQRKKLPYLAPAVNSHWKLATVCCSSSKLVTPLAAVSATAGYQLPRRYLMPERYLSGHSVSIVRGQSKLLCAVVSGQFNAEVHELLGEKGRARGRVYTGTWSLNRNAHWDLGPAWSVCRSTRSVDRAGEGGGGVGPDRYTGHQREFQAGRT